ncbi:BCCT family transporter [Aliamphritea spongicola]|uniref:BCCT family transporter n=1 Tax=Aliamphritea spongicola TaxID=707589 RepID=UPI00196ACA6A|nr:BCCT family transporter [Aliamphritea spongicola]MBN3564262.1 BCCT family transporter [Aliamphritea spongicola]
MKTPPPFTDIEVKTSPEGFYKGYSLPIAMLSKVSMTLLVLWALVWPDNAGSMLSSLNGTLLNTFNSFYIVVVGLFAFFCFAVAVVPSWGSRRLGKEGEKPEFSNFSWFSMMFGAGLGVGLMVYSTAEPMGLWGSNPVVLAGDAVANTAGAVESGMRYTFLHYGFHAWAIYVVTGLSLAYYAYTRNMPLTIRSALTPLLGRHLNGPVGHLVDVLGVVATILGVSVTIGFGISQLVDGVYAITGMEWLMKDLDTKPAPSTVGLLAALITIMGMSIISAVSGVGRGVKYLSNLNLVLSLILLLTFVFFGSFGFAMTTYGTALVDYILNFISLSFGAYGPTPYDSFVASLPEVARSLPPADLQAIHATGPWGNFESFKAGLPAALQATDNFDATAAAMWEVTEEGRQFGWQSAWTTFYWAWWIAFSPFVGLFLARISKGRTIREFVLGAVIAPALVCFAWMTILGGTAIDLELSGVAEGSIIGASATAKLFATLALMIDGGLLSAITIMCVVLIMTFLVTSADSGILVMNTIMSGGAQETGHLHRIIWGVLLTLVIATLLIAGGGGMDALKNAMIIGALPFTMIMFLMCLAMIKALIRDDIRDKEGLGAEPSATTTN